MNQVLPPPLPITVRPRPGEHYTSYIRRLAEANHLRPSLLRAYANTDAHAAKELRLDRLAALSGRSPSALRHALGGLPPKHPPATDAAPSRFKRYYPHRKIPRTAEARLEHDIALAAEQVRYDDQLELYTRIRADRALFPGLTIPQLARNHMLGEAHVREILHGLEPRPPGRRRQPKPAPTLEPVKALIRQMWREHVPADQIWSELVDNHGAAISKNTLKIYLRAPRHGATGGR